MIYTIQCIKYSICVYHHVLYSILSVGSGFKVELIYCGRDGVCILSGHPWPPWHIPAVNLTGSPMFQAPGPPDTAPISQTIKD